MKIRSLFCTLAFVSVAAFISVSCSKESGSSVNDALKQAPYKYVSSLMNEIYYWADEVTSPNMQDYENLEPYFYDCLVSKDRWSYMADGDSYYKEYQGINTSYGFEIGQAIEFYRDYSIYVLFVHENSPAAKAGVKRGWVLQEINGTDVTALVATDRFYTEFKKDNNTFTFLNSNRQQVKLTLAKSSFQASTILKSTVFTNDSYPGLTRPVGYINYIDFNIVLEQELKEAVAQMKAANVKELILDLRYNGGGYMSVLKNLANLLANDGCNGKLLFKQRYNRKYKEMEDDPDNYLIIKRDEGALDLDKLYIISGEGTASASEVIINGLRPLMNVKVVGDTTYGKPNGMFVFNYPPNSSAPDYVFLPICFYNVNSLGFCDYEDGLIPDNYRPDCPCADWEDDEIVRACLTDIVTGSFPVLKRDYSTKAGTVAGSEGKFILKNVKKERNYGRCIDNLK